MGGSATHWEVLEPVAEPPIPQLVYEFVYALRMSGFATKQFQNTISSQIHYKTYNR